MKIHNYVNSSCVCVGWMQEDLKLIISNGWHGVCNSYLAFRHVHPAQTWEIVHKQLDTISTANKQLKCLSFYPRCFFTRRHFCLSADRLRRRRTLLTDWVGCLLTCCCPEAVRRCRDLQKNNTGTTEYNLNRNTHQYN